MNLLFIDLDATLIDLTGFKSHLFSQLHEKYSIPQDKSISLYNSVKLLDRWPELLVHKLHTELTIPTSDLQKVFDSCFIKLTLNERVLEFVKSFPGKKYIFSFGTYDFQMQKIRQFHLEKEVDGIFITLEKKIEYLKDFIKKNKVAIDDIEYESVTIVDNDKTFLDAVQLQYPWIKVVNVIDLV